MWPSLFHAYNLRRLTRILRRSEGAILEIIDEDESKTLVEYLRYQKLWRVEVVSSSGFVHLDFPEKINKLLKNIDRVDHILIRKKYLQEFV